MPGLRRDVDPEGLLEFSVVFTDRSLNHMSQAFQTVVRDIHGVLCEAYNAKRAVIVPGGGTYAMEAVARQFATGRKGMGIRNGFFSYRWTQIFEAGSIPAEEIVLKARRLHVHPDAARGHAVEHEQPARLMHRVRQRPHIGVRQDHARGRLDMRREQHGGALGPDARRRLLDRDGREG